MEDTKFICCICYREFSGYGNNPDGAAWKTEDGIVEFGQFEPSDRCCAECDSRYVIPGRMYRLAKMRENK